MNREEEERMRYAIVGLGTAGYHAVKAIRAADRQGQIDVYGNTGLAAYNPMLTTYYVSGKLDFQGLFPFGDLEQLRRELNFTYRNEPVRHVTADRVVETGAGAQAYDRVLISTGARAFAPGIPGLDPEDRFLMRTVDDAKRLKERLERGGTKHAVVVGASMVGIKVVEALQKYGVEVYFADLAKSIFPLAAYPDVAAAIARRVEAQGTRLRLGLTIERMEREGGKQYALLTDGSRVPADLAALCIGTRAATETVQGVVEIGRGIRVNARMETSVEGIYAAGDCCEGRNLQSGEKQIIGLWANANHQGTAAGTNMAGGEASFDGNILHNITHFMNMDFIGFGDNRIQGEVLEQGSLDRGLFLRLVIQGGRIAGANILDNYRISGIIKNYMLRLFAGEREPIPDHQRAMLLRAGLEEKFLNGIEVKLHVDG